MTYTITIFSPLSDSQRRALSRWARRFTDRQLDMAGEYSSVDYRRGQRLLVSVLADDATPADAHRIARYAMLALGRTFDYDVVEGEGA